MPLAPCYMLAGFTELEIRISEKVEMIPLDAGAFSIIEDATLDVLFFASVY